MAFIPDEPTGMTSVTGVLLLVVTTVIIGAMVTVFPLQIGEGIPDPGPNAQVDIEPDYFGDGVQYNDSVTLTPRVGDRLRRDRIGVYIGGDPVYNETDNSGSNTGEDGEAGPGLILEADDNDFNNLNKPCRFKPEDCASTDLPAVRN